MQTVYRLASRFLCSVHSLSLAVGEGTPEREEDVVIIGRSKRDNSEFPAAHDECRLPKDAGDGEGTSNTKADYLSGRQRPRPRV